MWLLQHVITVKVFTVVVVQQTPPPKFPLTNCLFLWQATLQEGIDGDTSVAVVEDRSGEGGCAAVMENVEEKEGRGEHQSPSVEPLASEESNEHRNFRQQTPQSPVKGEVVGQGSQHEANETVAAGKSVAATEASATVLPPSPARRANPGSRHQTERRRSSTPQRTPNVDLKKASYKTLCMSNSCDRALCSCSTASLCLLLG